MRELRLDTKAVAITGGLGRIGCAVAQCLCESGARVLILDRAEALGNAACPTPTEGEWETRALDVTDFADLDARLAALEKDFAPLDGWVNCAYPRTPDWGAPFEKTTPEHWLRNLELQMGASCLWAEAAARAMARRNRGSVVSLGSVYGSQAPDFAIYAGTDKTTPAVYSAVKGGIVAHARWLASYFGPRGVRVNAVCPGGVRHAQSEPFLGNFTSRTLLGRMAEPREVGAAVVFLLSDGAGYITGQALLVDGGMSVF
ncbi:SDR family oxidoreductase [Desulfolutivibrio sulfoxidireducens]|uniref:SDR family oxidoreductase n=1 Tax=Desulfolutivibrio sulfoxidireducens TaxID=2773299 RepID=UPI00159D0F7B|nr:SDR family oxidoreductase [Desulfolutivibrio sulfoxidireducens]QLA17064.1 SDR family oxidoreductase [Desulfolutivibrio sulfoxidireducens]QLA20632.1 SDR family oxidoreductase [Desulfolutivibrio sulfoxidireducens]